MNLNDADRLSVNKELIQVAREAEEEYSKRKTIQIKDPGDLRGSILYRSIQRQIKNYSTSMIQGSL